MYGFLDLGFVRAGLALYQELEDMRYYLAFVFGTIVCFSYFIHANFWFLDIQIKDMTIRFTCVSIAMAAWPAFVLPGVAKQGRVEIVSHALAVQSFQVALLEDLLHTGCAHCLSSSPACGT